MDMPYISPDWTQPKLTLRDATELCARIQLTQMEAHSEAVECVLSSLRQSHANGGAFLAAWRIQEDPIFDRFASRNWLLQFQVLGRLLYREEIRASLPEVSIPSTAGFSDASAASEAILADGFAKESSYLFLGKLAWILHEGGAYHKPSGDGREAAEMAINFCDALFQNRFAEVECFINSRAWTPWFYDVNWDWTAVLIDLRKRIMWVLVTTDTD
jgi:hypothetical protein